MAGTKKSLHPKLLITCEHARAHIPQAYVKYFQSQQARKALDSHRGLDFGGEELSKRIAKITKAPFFFGKVSRLLVDLNRSIGHRRLFSEFIDDLDPEKKSQVVSKYYMPFRRAVMEWLQNNKNHSILHLSIHSFTPVLNGKRRRCDIGILFDPGRPLENRIARVLRARIQREFPDLIVHLNAPYRGTSDGHETLLRKHFSVKQYSGIEIEINQKFFLAKTGTKNRDIWQSILRKLPVTLSHFVLEC